MSPLFSFFSGQFLRLQTLPALRAISSIMAAFYRFPAATGTLRGLPSRKGFGRAAEDLPAGRRVSSFQFEPWQFRLCRNRKILRILRLRPPSPILLAPPRDTCKSSEAQFFKLSKAAGLAGLKTFRRKCFDRRSCPPFGTDCRFLKKVKVQLATKVFLTSWRKGEQDPPPRPLLPIFARDAAQAKIARKRFLL